MITVQNLRKCFDKFAALDDVTITVPKGAVYGLVGPNGAGKSTLLRHITGIYRQDAGEVLVDGESVYENPAIKARIGFISDDWYYFNQANVQDMMRFYRGLYPTFDMERYEAFKEVFSIPETAVLRRLSKGMQKQVAFWLTMCCMPDYLILDEPVDGLDPVMRRQVWSLIMNDVMEREMTVLVSSHNLRELEDVCDHVGIMEHGRVLLEHSLEELQSGITKIQIVLADETQQIPGELDILHQSATGRIRTLIVRGDAETVTDRLSQLTPLLLEALPLSLEEVFIYELGGVNYEVKDILL